MAVIVNMLERGAMADEAPNRSFECSTPQGAEILKKSVDGKGDKKIIVLEVLFAELILQ